MSGVVPLRPRPDVFDRTVALARSDRDRLLEVWTRLNEARGACGDRRLALPLTAEQAGALQRLLEQLV